MSYRVEAIRWVDAEHDSGDAQKATDLGKLPRVLSVGPVVHETDEAVVIALEVYEDGTVRDTLAIPKGMIRKRTRLSTVEF